MDILTLEKISKLIILHKYFRPFYLSVNEYYCDVQLFIWTMFIWTLQFESNCYITRNLSERKM